MAMFNRNSLPEEFEAEHGSVDLADGDRKPASGRSGAQQSPHDDREDEDLDLGRAGQRVWLCKVRAPLCPARHRNAEARVATRSRGSCSTNGSRARERARFWAGYACMTSECATEGLLKHREAAFGPPRAQPVGELTLDCAPGCNRKTPDGNAKISVLLNEHASTSGNGAASTSASTSEAKPDLKGKRPAHLAAAQAGDGLPTEYKLTMQNTASKNLYVFGEKIEDDLDTGEEGARKKRREFARVHRTGAYAAAPTKSPARVN